MNIYKVYTSEKNSPEAYVCCKTVPTILNLRLISLLSNRFALRDVIPQEPTRTIGFRWVIGNIGIHHVYAEELQLYTVPS